MNAAAPSPEAAALTPTLNFDPERPIDWTPEWHWDVTLIPWSAGGDRKALRAAGLFDAGGAFMPEGHCWRYHHAPITMEPTPPEDMEEPEELEGRWLFGGLFYGHFGHFLCETTSRLWALDQLGDIDGIVFFPKNQMTHERRHYRHQLPFFKALGLTEDKIRFRVPQKPVVIGELAIPTPAFGIGEMIEARPDYRRYMQSTLGRDIAADGAKDLYISRSRLPSKRGSVILEALIEEKMEKAGYTIFHPQTADISEQIAAYKSARRIVSLDASSLHMAAMLVGPETKVAIINRGPSNNIEDYVAQFTRWQGDAPTRIEAVTGFYFPEGRRVVKRETHATLDFRTVCAALVKDGFLPPSTRWANPSKSKIAGAVEAMATRVKAPLVHYELEA